MEEVSTSEKLINLYQTTRRNVPEDRIIQSNSYWKQKIVSAAVMRHI